MGAYVVERPADVEEGFTQSAPLVFHFGHTTPSKNLTLYNLLVSRIADVVNMKCDEFKKGTCISDCYVGVSMKLNLLIENKLCKVAYRN